MRAFYSSRGVRSTLFVLSFAVIAAYAAQAQVISNSLASRQVAIRKVVILPAKVEIVRSGMKGPEGMAAESDELSARVQASVAAILADKKHISRGESSLAGGSEANFRVADIQAKFDDLLPKIAKKKNDVKTGRFTLGDEIANLGVEKGTDAIVFIRGSGQALTSGKKAFNILVGGTPAYLSMEIVFVDARSGEVLAYAPTAFAGDPTTAVDKVRKAIEKGLKKLPAN